MFRLDGRSALVTGASRGIGRDVAQLFGAVGASVTLLGRNLETLEEAAAGIADARVVVGDASDPATISRAVDAAADATGRLDILVNNAGGPPPDAPLVTMKLDDFDHTIDFNLRAPLIAVREAWARSMREHGGSIVNIASIGGMSPPRLMGAYGTAKAALLYMTRMLAAELGPKVRVNAVSPGVVRTDATQAVPYDAYARILPMNRVGEARDVAAAVLFLASDEAGWITGENIAVDGGTLVQTAKLKPGWDAPA